MTSGQTDMPQFPGPSREEAQIDRGILEQFVARAQALTDRQRAAVAERRATVDEGLHEAALRAGAEALVERAAAYVQARRTLSTAHVPHALEEEGLPEEARRRWHEVARLMQLSIDEMLVALAGSDVLHPNHLRELSAPWGHRSDYSQPTTASKSSP